MAHSERGEEREKIRLFLVMLRELHHLTQAELAKRLDVQQGTLSKIERGLMRPNGELLMYAYRLDPLLFKRMLGH